ncbi:MAG: hypothetical protein K0S47_307 [Herbinix sp.]|jgi:hypothetical protein|nr:hypothetical protein [Herbinix sp.]
MLIASLRDLDKVVYMKNGKMMDGGDRKNETGIRIVSLLIGGDIFTE